MKTGGLIDAIDLSLSMIGDGDWTPQDTLLVVANNRLREFVVRFGDVE